MLDLLLAARDEDGEPLTDAELRDQLVTLLAAGHETTASGLAWAFERLSRHPEVLRRIRAGDDAYLDATVREVLRIRPVLVLTPRRLNAPLAFGGHDLPAGAFVSACSTSSTAGPTSTRSRSRSGPSAGSGRELPPYAFIPFGGGGRRCPGAAFASIYGLAWIQYLCLADLQILVPMLWVQRGWL